MAVPYRTSLTTSVSRLCTASMVVRSSIAPKSLPYRRPRPRHRCPHSWEALRSAATASAMGHRWAHITTISSLVTSVRALLASNSVTVWSSRALSATKCSVLHMASKCTPGARTPANGRSPARCATRRSATRSVCHSTGRCTRPRRRSSASSAANNSSARQRCPHIC